MHVVVVGGGLAGVGVATHLVRHAPVNVPLEVTLIDPKEYFEVRWAALRAFYDEGVRKEMHVPYSEILSKYGIAHCQARVSTLSKSAVITDAGALFKFDVCLIAVGASCALPGLDPVSLDIPTRRARMTAAGDSFINKDVLIIGGGTVGVEVAGEIAGYAQKAAKNVTLVHSGPRLAHTQLRAGASRLCQKKLEKMGVRVVLNAKAQEKEEGKDKGEWIVGDDVVKGEYVADCRGYKPVAAFMKKGELASALDEKGWIKVDNQFRVEGCEGRVFAMGDCCNKAEKTGVSAMKNIPVVAANIAHTLTALANNKGPADVAQLDLKKKKDLPPFTLLTLGPKTGVADTPLGATAAVLPMLKNKTMFIGHAKSACGI